MVLPLLAHCCETKMFVVFLKGIGENLGEDNEKSQKLKNTRYEIRLDPFKPGMF